MAIAFNEARYMGPVVVECDLGFCLPIRDETHMLSVHMTVSCLIYFSSITAFSMVNSPAERKERHCSNF